MPSGAASTRRQSLSIALPGLGASWAARAGVGPMEWVLKPSSSTIAGSIPRELDQAAPAIGEEVDRAGGSALSGETVERAPLEL